MAKRVEVVVLSRNDPISGCACSLSGGTTPAREARRLHAQPVAVALSAAFVSQLFPVGQRRRRAPSLGASVAARVMPLAPDPARRRNCALLFDGDAVLFSVGRAVFNAGGCRAFRAHERARAHRSCQPAASSQCWGPAAPTGCHPQRHARAPRPRHGTQRTGARSRPSAR